jgi:hypothetical protein
LTTISTFRPSISISPSAACENVGRLGIALGDERSDRGDLLVVVVGGELFHLGTIKSPGTRAYEKGRQDGGPFAS